MPRGKCVARITSPAWNDARIVAETGFLMTAGRPVIERSAVERQTGRLEHRGLHGEVVGA